MELLQEMEYIFVICVIHVHTCMLGLDKGIAQDGDINYTLIFVHSVLYRFYLRCLLNPSTSTRLVPHSYIGKNYPTSICSTFR